MRMFCPLFKFWSHFRTTKMGLQGLLDCFVPLPNVAPLTKSPSFVFHFSSCSFYLFIEDRYAYLTWGTGWNTLQYWWCHGNLILKHAHFRKKYPSTRQQSSPPLLTSGSLISLFCLHEFAYSGLVIKMEMQRGFWNEANIMYSCMESSEIKKEDI